MKRNGVEISRLPVFAERFRALQGERSNTEFASFLGMSRQTVGFYLNGDRIPDALVLKEIAEKCGVSADWLLGLADNPSTSQEEREITRNLGLDEAAIKNMKSYVSQGHRNLTDVLNEIISRPDLLQAFDNYLNLGFDCVTDIVENPNGTLKPSGKRRRLIALMDSEHGRVVPVEASSSLLESAVLLSITEVLHDMKGNMKGKRKSEENK